MNIIFEIFLSFLKIGAFTIGGGYAMLSVIEDEVVNKKKWLENEEFIDGMAIAQSTPGVLAVNISIITGYRIAGYGGMIAGILGSVLPSFLIVVLLSKFLLIYKDSPIFIAIFNGIKPAVVALIFLSVFRIGKSSKITLKTVIIPIIIALIIKFTPISPIYIIIAIMILGNIILLQKEKYTAKELEKEKLEEEKLEEEINEDIEEKEEMQEKLEENLEADLENNLENNLMKSENKKL